MVTLSAFADEISSDLNEQLDVLESTGIRHLEFRGVWHKNVIDLTDEELEQVRSVLRARGFKISAIGSPIGKIRITDDFGHHLNQLNRAIDVAQYFGTKYIRIFSFFIPQGHSAKDYRNEVLWRLQEFVHRAQTAGVVLLHENEKGIYGDITERCVDIFSSCPSPHFRAAFDPANFVQCGVRPYTDAFAALEAQIEYVHIKDALLESKRVVPPGEGDGELRDVLSALFAKGYDGFLSIEPHLAQAKPFSGFSGPELFRVAADALKDMLAELHQTWR
ncbi:sugar phosphate isomerase/epimerase family protein [Alicyclobacillus acidoterrestris]|uniref:Sugar phosphate isomerase/epimerase n=1 Tax=Alicyclobacillus acidoterrestris (strain ATCC 49025 / DSM 3922 / CIP 106132 / NCIMB 13137 / GD3B) TaxID=1356854 RepID=T0CWE3_ALIAG|nr:sugar phosphate isomerase/epimerase family protein [Alicyclobacillus acidoterrestris]EPZ41851.1 hypothetical protein N007_16385 [Alicyclobacillus acidoterrestris ATCC 49025]UNO49756.1 sugar phosphate isomerase/epimerase [Alicyclobacillus acidoterrestris]